MFGKPFGILARRATIVGCVSLYVCRNKVAHASAFDKAVATRLMELDRRDKAEVEDARKNKVEAAFPYLKGQEFDEYSLVCLSWVKTCCVKPLDAAGKVELRKTIKVLMERKTWPKEGIDGFIKLLEEYDCL
jgi:hypothetical protein